MTSFTFPCQYAGEDRLLSTWLLADMCIYGMDRARSWPTTFVSAHIRDLILCYKRVSFYADYQNDVMGRGSLISEVLLRYDRINKKTHKCLTSPFAPSELMLELWLLCLCESIMWARIVHFYDEYKVHCCSLIPVWICDPLMKEA